MLAGLPVGPDIGFRIDDEDPYWTMAVVRLACLIEVSLAASIEYIDLAMS